MTERVGLVTVVIAVAIAGLSTDVAVIVTGKPPVGTVAGAVYVLGTPLAVVGGFVNDPHCPAAAELVQLADQVTPFPDGSFDTVAITFAVLPA